MLCTYFLFLNQHIKHISPIATVPPEMHSQVHFTLGNFAQHSEDIMNREDLIAKIRNIRQQLQDADKEERRILLEELCVLYARLATAR